MTRRHLRAGGISAALFFLLAAYTPAGHADGNPPTTGSADAVDALLLKAFDLRREHRNEEALAVYNEAFALAPTPAVRAQRALAEQALGHWLVAERELDLSLAADDAWVRKNSASLESARSVVRQHLAWLTVEVDVPNADIRLDGEPIQPGVAARVVAGAGVLEVRAPGHVVDIRRVSLGPAEHVRKQVSLTPIADAVPLPPPTSQPPPPPRPPVAPLPSDSARFPVSRLVPIGLGVVALAAIGTGAYFGVQTIQDKNTQSADQTAYKCTPQSCSAQAEAIVAHDSADANNAAQNSNVAFVVGGAFLVAGGVVWYLESRSSHPTTSGALSVAPVVGPGARGLVLRGSF